MKWLLVILILLCAGCQNIRHKSFRTTIAGTGGKMTLIDPTGSGNVSPMIVLGSYTSSITTIPIGSNAKYSMRSYELFSGNLLFEETMDITTASGEIKITDDKVTVGDDRK